MANVGKIITHENTRYVLHASFMLELDSYSNFIGKQACFSIALQNQGHLSISHKLISFQNTLQFWYVNSI